MRKVKWGVLGVAKIATEKVIPAMQRAERCDIAAIASRDEAKARVAAQRLGIPRAYGSYDALLADPEIEAVYNPLPNELHVPWTIQALEAGKHVLCEKPVALDAEEARRLIAARDKTGRLVAEAFMVRFHPQWRRARELRAVRRDRRVGGDPDLLLLSPARPGQRAQPAARRRRALRHRLLRDPDRALRLRRRAHSRGRASSTATRISAPTGSRARCSNFPRGRHLTFTVATQLSADQRVTIVGETGRIEVLVPFNALPDRPMRIVIDDGSTSWAARRARRSSRSATSTACRETPSRARFSRGAARIRNRGRRAQHARHRRAVPVGGARRLGDAVTAARRPLLRPPGKADGWRAARRSHGSPARAAVAANPVWSAPYHPAPSAGATPAAT